MVVPDAVAKPNQEVDVPFVKLKADAVELVNVAPVANNVVAVAFVKTPFVTVPFVANKFVEVENDHQIVGQSLLHRPVERFEPRGAHLVSRVRPRVFISSRLITARVLASG